MLRIDDDYEPTKGIPSAEKTRLQGREVRHEVEIAQMAGNLLYESATATVSKQFHPA